jgi:hypothetical protein
VLSGEAVGVGVLVDVAVGVGVLVEVAVGVGVLVEVAVGGGVPDDVAVGEGVQVGVAVGPDVPVDVAVGEGVLIKNGSKSDPRSLFLVAVGDGEGVIPVSVGSGVADIPGVALGPVTGMLISDSIPSANNES